MKLTLVTLIVALFLPSVAKARPTVHKSVTALTWLTNPAHHKQGTRKARVRMINKYERSFYKALKSVGFLRPALCVHSHEAIWHDPNAPYYGGMQMDVEFQRDYGIVYYDRWGTADNWPVWAQLHAAYKGYQDRGWWPWPNTARDCGLL